TSNFHHSKNKKLPTTDTLFSDKICASFSVKVDENEIGKIEFICDIQYKGIATEQVNTTVNDQYQFYGNRELDFEHVRESTDITDEPLGNRETVSQNNSRRDQVPEVIEILSHEDQIPETIEISSDEAPEIIELSSDDDELIFEKNQIVVSRDQTPETAI
ncbi:5582_t:CDS:2, partial [Racocetra persica]